ncbi:MAG TPA: hypothetical protein VF796_13860 [Humisphaera sp.]
MTRTYHYVGPQDVRARAAGHAAGAIVLKAADLLAWAKAFGLAAGRGEAIPATFVVDAEGRLRVADRRSEHVECAGGGGDVLSAGEMFFAIDGCDVRVEEVSNQSTGYCPESESWPAVAEALERAGIEHPGGFTTVCVFRRCEACGERSIVKDGWFQCDVCGAKLPVDWNFA